MGILLETTSMKLLSSFLLLQKSLGSASALSTSCADLPAGEDGAFVVYPFKTSEGEIDENEPVDVYCEWDEDKNATTYIPVDSDDNYSIYHRKMLSDKYAHKCPYTLSIWEPKDKRLVEEWRNWWRLDDDNTKEVWDEYSWTYFDKVELNINNGVVTINRENTKWARLPNKFMHGDDHKDDYRKKAYGTAGDCFSSNACERSRAGYFKVAPFTKWNTNLGIDWERTGDWVAEAIDPGKGPEQVAFINDERKRTDSFSADCGGRCGQCAPSTEIHIGPKSRIKPIPIELSYPDVVPDEIPELNCGDSSVTKTWQTQVSDVAAAVGPVNNNAEELRSGLKFQVDASQEIYFILSKYPTVEDAVNWYRKKNGRDNCMHNEDQDCPWVAVLASTHAKVYDELFILKSLVYRLPNKGGDVWLRAWKTHSYEEFQKWQCNFQVKMSENTFGLYDSAGNVIVEEEALFDATGYKYLYVATEPKEAATFKILANNSDEPEPEKPEPEKPEPEEPEPEEPEPEEPEPEEPEPEKPEKPTKRDPLIRINKVHANFNAVLLEVKETILTKQGKFIENMSNKIEKQVENAINYYKKVNPKCNYFDADEQPEVERYHRDDPCKGVKQLATAVSKWAAEY